MPRHPGQGSMTKGRPPGKRELGEGGREKGKAVDRWRGTRDMRRDSITLRQDKYKVNEKEAQRDMPDRGTKRGEDEGINDEEVVYISKMASDEPNKTIFNDGLIKLKALS